MSVKLLSEPGDDITIRTMTEEEGKKSRIYGSCYMMKAHAVNILLMEIMRRTKPMW